jgi:hypothetical protein
MNGLQVNRPIDGTGCRCAAGYNRTNPSFFQVTR